MMRTLYDAVNIGNIPANATMVAGYVNGLYQTYPALVARFPTAIKISITINNTGIAQVLDVENGDATPFQAPGWVTWMRSLGQQPTVYTNSSTWPEVQQAFNAVGVAQPMYWIAHYDNDPTIPAGAVAKQYASGNYDISSVVNYWPGVDTIPTDDSLLLFLIGGPMSLTLNDTDAHNAAARLLYITYLDREPTTSEQSFWAGQIASKGFDAAVSGVYDSLEAQSFRKRRGW